MVHEPADSDHAIVPTARTTPITTKTQGFVSYIARGVQARMAGILQPGAAGAAFRYTRHVQSSILKRAGLASAWSQEAVMALITLGVGFGLMPLLIYYAGSTLLGRYDGASPARLYDAVYQGLAAGSAASMVVVFGPYGLYLVAKALRLWWRASARLA